ncbi:MAG: glutamine-synthetase adenylyltransferase, partial [Pseudomonadota bacterium]
AMILGMGSLGAGRLHARSDLDLLFVYDPDGVEASDGPRPLATRSYYSRLTQALITALSAPMAAGRLYEVDMRLRPSGRHGPVATSIDAFEVYQQDEAWTWEHLALTRARPITGAANIGARVQTLRRSVLGCPRNPASVAQDVIDMRARLAAAKPGKGGLSVKDGRGRLQDIELFAQSLALLTGSDARETDAQIKAGVAAGLIPDADGAALTTTATLLWQVRSAMELIGTPGQNVADLGEGALSMVLRDTGAHSRQALLDKLTSVADACDAQITGHLSRWAADIAGRTNKDET